jgi:hypothetical protein
MSLSARMLGEDEYLLWDAFVLAQDAGSVFNTSRWLDHRREGDFHVIICEDNGEWLGGFAFLVNRKLGLRRIVRPILTLYHSPVIADALRGDRQATLRKEVLRTIFRNMPRYDALSLTFPPRFPISPDLAELLSLPLEHFTTRTNRICPPKNADDILAGYSRNARHELDHAARDGIAVSRACGLDEVHRLASLSMAHAGRSIPLGRDELARMLVPFASGNEVLTMCAHTSDGTIAAAALLICDSRTCYGLLSGVDRGVGRSACGFFLIHHCIVRAMECNLCFDFGGSTIPGVASFFHKFRPTLHEVHHFVHVRTRRIRFLDTITTGIGHRLY